MPRVPDADESANLFSKQAIGNKTDTAVYVAGTTKSAMAYLKGLANAHGSRCVSSGAGAIATTDATTIFTYTGVIRLQAVVGVITTVFSATATTLKLSAQSDALTPVDICAASASLANAAVGTSLNITGTVANAMVVTTLGVAIAQAGAVVCTCKTAGKITYTAGTGTNTGAVTWACFYNPCTPGAVLTAAY